MAKLSIEEGSLQHRFLQSTSKIQLIGGGFGNGKTTAVCIKAIELAKAYPGSNGLIARETYPKLNDTVRKEFLKWCPKDWIKSFPMGQNASNTCTLRNGSMINFRYIAQQGKNSESTTSNLLSATYDWIIVDQIEDPGITYKDFLDLLGRLRGNTPRASAMSFIDERTLSSTGPRWFIMTTNPTRNWVYKKLVQPVHDYVERGVVSPDLICERDANDVPLVDDNGRVRVLIELFEGSTYENAANLGADFIKTLEATYRGQMRERFLLGQWGAYEGLIYPQANPQVHGVPYKTMFAYMRNLYQFCVPTIIEAYDYGMAVPSCYLYAFVDFYGNVHVLDGFYEKECSVARAAAIMKELRARYASPQYTGAYDKFYADPDIFRRKAAASGHVVGRSIASMFAEDYDIDMQRGNNDVINGITKVQTYMNCVDTHVNPYTGALNAPHLYVANELEFWWNEVTEYSWQKSSTTGESVDKPIDRNDHAMDATKYLLSEVPEIRDLVPDYSRLTRYTSAWSERETQQRDAGHRYGRT